MRFCIVGCNGQLGTDLMHEVVMQGHEVVGYDVPEINLANEKSVGSALDAARPDIVVNSAAFTAVDACETQKETAFKVNADGVGVLGRRAKAAGVPVVHIGTDYVFDGKSTRPYIESDSPNPLTVYGQSKLAGENILAQTWERHWVLRIAWLYGAAGKNFVKTILRAALKNQTTGAPLKVVNDQFGTPTWTVSVCSQILHLVTGQDYGVFHGTSQGGCSWFDFAQAIVALAKIEVPVIPCSTAEYPRPAPRPAYSVLENARLKQLGVDIMPTWQQGLAGFWNRHASSILTELKEDLQ